MDSKDFALSSREEVATFESSLVQYCKLATSVDLPQIPLVKAYELLDGLDNGSKLFAALLDLNLNFVLLHLDIFSAGAVWNQNFSKGKLEGGSVLDSYEKFSGKLELHRHISSFVLRYRALWDKIMGVLVLALEPSEYERFAKANKKKAAFEKIVQAISNAEGHVPTNLKEFLEHFDNNFRTPEAHGTGSLRKHTFSMAAFHESPQIELIGFWNAANDCISRIANNLELILSYHYAKPALPHSAEHQDEDRYISGS